jgi:cytochrome c oxidase cbb3-type subunit 1
MRVSHVSARADGIESATLHALFWLLAGNAVGLLLATLLVFPGLNAMLGGATYGRWVPVHHNLVLYGWCALPLVGVLFRVYADDRRPGRLPGSAVAAWSGSLVLAAAASILGHGGGKPFLEWSGPARVALAASTSWLWIVLALSFFARRDRERAPAGLAYSSKLALLLSLAVVPVLLYRSAAPEVQPAVNPDSGGPTGGNLLGSTLGIVALIALAPWLAGARPLRGRRPSVVLAAALAIHFAWFVVLDHGDRSHHEVVQIASLASVIVWLPLLAWYLLGFGWPPAARRWLGALGGWGAVLALSAIPTFLPAILDRVKFTNALVAHAHVAMGGFVTSLVTLLSIASNRDTRLRDVFVSRSPFALWHAGCAVMFVALTCAGWIEAVGPGALYRSAPVIDALYVVRWIAGAMMVLASAIWTSAAYRAVGVEETMPATRPVRHEAA